MDDTPPLGKPLHGHGHRRVTLSQVFKTRSGSQLLHCSNGEAAIAFTGQKPHRHGGGTGFKAHDQK